MALLYSKAHANSDESAALVASKTIFINSIETLKADLERLRTDLGGSGTSCSRSKFRNRHRKRSIFSDLLSTINNAVCSLTKIQADIETVPPDLDEIEADWVEIDGLADELTEEEEEEEKGEEEEEETQSAEEEKASKTSSMRSSSTSVSSVSAYFFSDMIEPYPAEYYEPAAAENAVFAAAGAALFAAMGGSGGGTAGISDSSTSIISSSVPRASAETSTNLPSRITDGYWLNGVWIPGGSGKNGITSSTVNATTSTLNRFATLALNSPSVTTTLKKATAPNIPDKANTVNALSEFLQTVHFAQVSTSGITPLAASISEASASRVSAEKASAAAASAAAVSASKASALAASAAAASAAAAAASFPSQISSNQGSSSLCKSIGHASCIFAYSLYNPLYFYTEYTSYIYTTGGFDGEWLGWGCAAMFKCYTSEDYAKGMGGQEILNAFEYLYAEDGVEICGTIYMDNGCYLTVNACASCKSSIPCEALPEKDQPPDGGVPCYYTNGTTWPSTSDSSGSDCWKCE